MYVYVLRFLHILLYNTKRNYEVFKSTTKSSSSAPHDLEDTAYLPVGVEELPPKVLVFVPYGARTTLRWGRADLTLTPKKRDMTVHLISRLLPDHNIMGIPVKKRDTVANLPAFLRVRSDFTVYNSMDHAKHST